MYQSDFSRGTKPERDRDRQKQREIDFKELAHRTHDSWVILRRIQPWQEQKAASLDSATALGPGGPAEGPSDGADPRGKGTTCSLCPTDYPA